MGLIRASRRSAGAALALIGFVIGGPASAQAIAEADICGPDHNVDPERLALYVLAKAGVSNYPYHWTLAHQPTDPKDKRSPAVRVVAEEKFCPDTKETGADIPQCAASDEDSIGNARNLAIDGLKPAQYILPDQFDGGASLFSMTPPTVGCRVNAGGVYEKPHEVAYPAPFDFNKIPLRIRGSTDGLQFDRNYDPAFNGVDKATITFKSDQAQKQDSTKASIVVALAVPIKENVLEFVPYFGFSTDTSKKEGQDKTVNTDILRAGALLDLRLHSSGISHLFLVRPEYAADRKTHSEMVFGTFTYQPIVNGVLNTVLNQGANVSLFSIIPRLDTRIVTGNFTKLGDRLPENSHNFVRVGGQVGFTVYSDLKWMPLELTVTETYLHALKGVPDNLSYLKGVFSLYFDPKKYFGVDLGYARGRKDDISDREQNWTFGFGAKF